MTNDIAPELFDKISAEFERLYGGNAKIKTLLAKINAGTATYAEAEEYAELVGRTCSASMLRYLGDDVLPDSRLYYNIAERTVRPMLEQSRNMAEEIAMSVQESLNMAAGIRLKAVKPKLDDSRVKNIVDKVSDAEKFSDASWVLDAPVVNMTMNVVDETVKANAELHSKSGMKAKIVRRQTVKCCEWCANLAGTYMYPEVPEDVYRRHENCRCVVTYVPKKGKAQDVWPKKEYTSEREAVEARLNALESVKDNKTNKTVSQTAQNVMPEYLRNASPGIGRIEFEEGFIRETHQEEMEMSKWVFDNLGGRIINLKEKNTGGYNPDYIWNEKVWDLKSPKEGGLDGILRKGLHQIDSRDESPGGFFVKLRKEDDIDLMVDKAIKRVKRKKFSENVDILFIQSGELVRAIRV